MDASTKTQRLFNCTKREILACTCKIAAPADIVEREAVLDATFGKCILETTKLKFKDRREIFISVAKTE